MIKHPRLRHRRGRDKESGYILGVILLIAGGLLFASKAGYLIPKWIFSWPMILIAVGLSIGIKHRFRGSGWLWPLAIGAFFLFDNIFPQFFPREYFWPFMLVLGGLFLIFRPRMAAGWDGSSGSCSTNHSAASATDQDRLDDSSIFGTIRKMVLSKNFTGGEVSTIFGSAEINLVQADFQVPPKLELNAVFGSIKLIVPSHWQLKMENNAVLGGVQDHRPQHSIYSDKVMYLEANAVFGGIEITTV